MIVKITEREVAMIETLSRNKTFVALLKRIIDEHCDIRNIPEGADREAEMKSREDAIKIIDENLLDRMRIVNGEKEPSEAGREME
jgi:hypothetical protein